MINISTILNTSLFKNIIRGIGLHSLWVIAHYYSTHLYYQWCTPPTFLGLFFSPLLITSPQCKALLWCIVQGSTMIETLWVIIGLWCTTNLVIK
jgi:hypothetical protein